MSRYFPWVAAFATLCLHLAGNPHYGFFRDELYFIICGLHPQFGYVDQPPVVPLLAALTQLGGHSLFLLRAVPAICAAGGAYATVLLVNEFGGGTFAQVLATIAFIGSPVLMAFGMKVGADEIGLWLWPLIALLVLRIARGADPRTWLTVGALAGIAGESKYTALFFFVALLAGLLATPERRILRSRWALAGTALGLAIVLPNFLWQAANGFPMWELLEAGQHGKNVIVSPPIYLLQQLALMNPYLAPVWIVGLVWLLRMPRVRFLGLAYVVLIAEMLVLHGKHYYPADVYPILIAAGAVPIEAWTRRIAAARIGTARTVTVTVTVRVACIAYAAVFAALLVPLELPVLSETQLVAYQQAVIARIVPLPKNALASEHNAAPEIGSDYADMHGWPEFAAAVRTAYLSIPPKTRAGTVVFAMNYGEASALRFFAPDVPTISGHNQFWLWGYGGANGDTILELGGSCWASDHGFARADVVARYATTLPVMGYENDRTFLVCRGRRLSMPVLWEDSKTYE
jgi:4-amino-4-deoxy-L-arabinose transferase-like glycosyltransferase